MIPFYYKLKTITGDTTKGTVSAPTLQEARALLHTQNHILISLKPISIWQKKIYRPTLKTPELLDLFRSLRQLCRAGLPLIEALKSLQHQNKQKSYQSIIHLLEGGSPLSTALRQSNLITNEILLSFLQQAELTGDYPHAFDHITTHLNWLNDLKKRLKKTLAYPTLILGMSIFLIIFLMHFVVPQLLDLYRLSDMAIPPMTQALMTFSKIVPLFIFIGFCGLLGLAVCVLFLFLYARYRPHVLERFLKLFFKTPLIGRTIRDIVLLQYAKNMSVLLATQKDNMLKTMTSANNCIHPQIFNSLFLKARLHVEQGLSFSQSLQQSFPLPTPLFKILQVGERAGTLSNSLEHIAHYSDSHLQERLNKAIQRLGPLMLLLVGGLLIFIISAVFLPLYSGLGGLDR